MRCRRFASLQGRIRFLSATRFSPRPIPAKTRINSCFGGSGWRERRQARWRFRRREFGPTRPTTILRRDQRQRGRDFGSPPTGHCVRGGRLPLSSVKRIASFVHERLDGSGYFRGTTGKAIPMEARILGTVVAWVELRSERPWRKALSASEAVAQLMKEAKIGRFDPNIVEYVGSARLADRQPRQRRSNTIRLSSRETEVLHRISLGASNKEVARDLDLSPSTVRTHVESVFRK